MPSLFKGAASKVMLEQLISSHLAPLNGKYKLLATETTYQPGGFMSLHDHVGLTATTLDGFSRHQTSLT